MKPEYHYVENISVELDAEKILKGQGIEPSRASERLFDGAREIIVEAARLLQPRAVYSTVLVSDFTHDKIAFAGGSFTGRLVAQAMAGAKELSIALCTIGSDLEEQVTQLMHAGDTFRAMALDGAGVAAIREVSRLVANKINSVARERGLDTGMKASPGQEGWSLEQQRLVFDLLPASELGVTLTESCLMVPRKSVTFVIGMGPEMREDAVPCDFCSKQGRCRWRNKRPDLSDQEI